MWIAISFLDNNMNIHAIKFCIYYIIFILDYKVNMTNALQ